MSGPEPRRAAGLAARLGVRRQDLAMAATLLVIGQLEVALRTVEDPVAAHLVWAAIALAALYRGRAPVLFAVAAFAGAAALRELLGLTLQTGGIFAVVPPLAIFTLGTEVRGQRAATVLTLLATAVAIGGTFLLGVYPPGVPGDPTPTEWAKEITIFLVAAIGGLAMRDRTEALARAAERVVAMPPLMTAVERAAERDRRSLAVELQGVVSLCLARVAGLAASAITELRGRGPDAAGAIGAAREAAQEAMEEMRRMLGLLRGDEPPSVPAPAADSAGATRLAWAARLVRRQGLPLLVLLSGTLFALFAEGRPAEAFGDAALPVRLLGAVASAAVFLPRRRMPLATVAGTVAVTWARMIVLDDVYPIDLTTGLAVYVAGAYVRDVRLAALAAAGALGGTIGIVLAQNPETPAGLILGFAVFLLVVFMESVSARRKVLQTELLAAAEREERLRREALAERAVTAQRLHLARELHDLVGHGLTAITLQCAAAERTIGLDRRAAEEAIGTVERLAAGVRAELGALLAALEGEGEERPPRLEQAGALAGLAARCEVRIEASGDLEGVPAGPGAAAYRILQESLANAAKHSTGEVVARLERSPDAIRIEVRNPTGERPGPGFGLGLVGMKERAELYGGSLDAGPAGSGEWRVRAELPLAPDHERRAGPTLHA